MAPMRNLDFHAIKFYFRVGDSKSFGHKLKMPDQLASQSGIHLGAGEIEFFTSTG
jgi:hypothetical protein